MQQEGRQHEHRARGHLDGDPFRKGGGLVDAPDARMVRTKGKSPLRLSTFVPLIDFQPEPIGETRWEAAELEGSSRALN